MDDVSPEAAAGQKAHLLGALRRVLRMGPELFAPHFARPVQLRRCATLPLLRTRLPVREPFGLKLLLDARGAPSFPARRYSTEPTTRSSLMKSLAAEGIKRFGQVSPGSSSKRWSLRSSSTRECSRVLSKPQCASR